MAVKQVNGVCHHRPNLLRQLQVCCQGLLIIHRRFAEVLLQHKVVIIHQFRELLGELFFVQYFGQANPPPCCLVLIGWPDTPPGSTQSGVPRLIKCRMGRQNDRAGAADPQSVTDRHPVGFKLEDLLEQGFQTQHHAVADNALHAVPENARRQQMQYRLVSADDQRMAGIVATLETGNHARLFGKQINDLALALVTPLGAQHYNTLSHLVLSG